MAHFPSFIPNKGKEKKTRDQAELKSPNHLRPVIPGRPDFRNQCLEPDHAGNLWKMRKVTLTLEKQGSEEIPWGENAENADTKTRLIGFNVTGFG